MPNKPAIYADAACFIDAVKFDTNTQLEDLRRKDAWYFKKLLQAHRDREITVYTSTLSIAEATHIGKTPVPQNVQKAFDALLTSGQYCYLIQDTPFICMDARDLRWRDDIALRGPDSIHLSSALNRECAEFISLDKRFSRIEEYSEKLAGKGIRIIIPSHTKVLPKKYLQGDLLGDAWEKNDESTAEE